MLNEIKVWVVSHWNKLSIIGLALVAALLEAFLPGNPATQPLVTAIKAVALLFGVVS